MTPKVTVIDYGMGNLWSVISALKYLGADCVISSNPQEVVGADMLLLPGVGSFRKAMEALQERGLVDAINEAVLVRQRKILGICLGMQLFAEVGTEDGQCLGLGFIPGTIERFSVEETRGLKIPHVGFNSVEAPAESRLFSGLTPRADFYFVHSYRLLTGNLAGKCGICHYGVDFVATYEHQNIFATQFHPEKSQTNGLRLLSNFLTA
ncbi:MAG: hypothetical protein RIR18_711 [Pseudomonadota bacterium]